MAAYSFVPGELGISRSVGELSPLSDTDLANELAAMKAYGADHLRTDLFFDVIKSTSSGAYNWTQHDRVIDAANAAGLKVIGVLNGTPSWVNNGYTTTADKTAFGNFAGAAASHYGSDIAAYEVLNEPNFSITAANYAGVLDAAHDAIKAVDSTKTVITGGLSPIPTNGGGSQAAATYLSAMYANGVASNSDGIGFHPYSHPLSPTTNNDAWNGWEIMESEVRTIMSNNGDSSTPVWITEYGGGPTKGTGGAVTEANQALYLGQAIDSAQGHSWAGPMSVYTWKDLGGDTSNSENWFGMARPDNSDKPSMEVFYNEALNDPTFATQNFTGGSGDDLIIGNSQNNTIDGAGGVDTIRGGGGNDTINGNAGNDLLSGGTGADTFDFNDTSTGMVGLISLFV